MFNPAVMITRLSFHISLPDFDIPLLGISRHRNVVFHSAILPLLITVTTITNVALKIASAETFRIGAEVKYYITALFLLVLVAGTLLTLYFFNLPVSSHGLIQQ